MINLLSVSVVIPAYNCEGTIKKTLQSVFAQTYPSINVIVVDDGSTDKTAQIIQSFNGVTYFYQKNAGPAAARNHGAKESKDEIVFFTDSDCVPAQDWIEKGVKPFQEERVVVVAGSYGIVNEENILARCIHKEILYRHHHLMPRYPKVFGSYNFGVRKKVFEEVGGFNESYRYASGEDNDLSYKILEAGYKIYFEKEALVNHFHPTHIIKYLQEQYRHGFWRVKMYADHPSMGWGDDYTFWKDIVEAPTALLIVVSLLGMGFGLSKMLMLFLLMLLIIIEIFYGWIITKNFCESFLLSSVMFFRSFFRVFGLSSGVLYFLSKKLCKNT